MRNYFGLNNNTTGGVLVSQVSAYAASLYNIKKDDIILELDGVPVEDDGKVYYEERLCIHFYGAIAVKKLGEGASLKIWRDRKSIDLSIILSAVLEHSINIGYTSYRGWKVLLVNEKPVETIERLCKIIIATRNKEYLRFDLEYGNVIIINMKSHKRSHLRLLESHNITRGISKELESAFPELV